MIHNSDPYVVSQMIPAQPGWRLLTRHDDSDFYADGVYPVIGWAVIHSPEGRHEGVQAMISMGNGDAEPLNSYVSAMRDISVITEWQLLGPNDMPTAWKPTASVRATNS